MLTSPPVLAEAACDVRLSGRVVLLDASQPFSFAYGALTPQVALSRGLLESVCTDELRAVLQHERYHVVNRDPLKALFAQTLSATFFFIPALESLRLRYLAARELSADRSAATMCGRPPLAGALLKVFQGSQWTDLDGVAAIGGPELLDARVAQLETGTEPKLPEISLIRGALSLLGAALFAALFLASASVLGAVFSATELLDAFLCAAPLSGLGIAAYWFIARRAGRRLCVGERD
jgi:beta-lactamase regulating signal transducer with metallopeptidase domain